MKDSVRKTVRWSAVLMICMALTGWLCAVSAADWLGTGDWIFVETEFMGIEYEAPILAAIPGVVQSLSWGGEEEGLYWITDAEGRIWKLDPNRELDTGTFYQRAEPGDRLTLWADDEFIEAMTCGDTVYRSYGDAVSRARQEGTLWVILSAAAFALAVFFGAILLRLRREGEAFWKKLPKWVREV